MNNVIIKPLNTFYQIPTMLKIIHIKIGSIIGDIVRFFIYQCHCDIKVWKNILDVSKEVTAAAVAALALAVVAPLQQEHVVERRLEMGGRYTVHHRRVHTSPLVVALTDNSSTPSSAASVESKFLLHHLIATTTMTTTMTDVDGSHTHPLCTVQRRQSPWVDMTEIDNGTQTKKVGCELQKIDPTNNNQPSNNVANESNLSTTYLARETTAR